MYSLPPNASAAEIEDEIDVTQVLINSLDADADDHQSQKQELEGQMQELQTLLAQAHRSPQTYPTSMQHTPVRQQSSPESSHSASVANSSPYGTKRPVSSLGPEQARPFKRHTPTPSPLPHKDYQHLRSSHAEAARRRQLAVEAAIKRQTDYIQADAALALKLSQSRDSQAAIPGPSSQPVWQSTLRRDGGILPSSRPLFPAASSSSSQNSLYTLQPPVSQPRIKPEHPTSMDLAHRPRHSSADVVDLTADSDDERATLPPARFALPRLSASIPSSRAAPPPYSAFDPNAAYNPYPMPGVYPMPNGVTRNAGIPAMTPRNVYPMPNGVARHAGSPALGFGNVYPPARVVYPPSHPLSSQNQMTMRQIQAASLNTLNTVRATNGHSSSEFGQLDNLINGSQSNPHYLDEGDDDGDVMFQGSNWRVAPRIDPYANHADLFRERYEKLEQYNPEKTREELNSLLLNIRPDEELPDHLLVATPEAMTIKLHKYQELGLTWLQKAEECSNKGGILADDMGLGKTIQMISLIVTRKSEDPRCKTTLIVAPVALLRQWKQEIEQKVKSGRHALTVFIHHGLTKKQHWRELQVFDVVITTFGSLAAELKRLEKFNLRQKYDPQVLPRKDEQCTLIDPDCRWYRVILDEAQCIKNKSTQTAKAASLLKATYRFCMTGTPMMNNVSELYSLINFLRIKPYNSWERFNLDFVRPLRSGNAEGRNGAMKMLQVLCKAIMLRRTKKSEYRGKPILVLPERTTDVDHATFDEDEQSLYTSLEQRTQITFNKYLRAGTVGRSYSAILVLLLRLRQACCHPHLIKDFSIGAAADLSDDALLDLARQLDESVVTRIKATEGNFECPICMDACINPAIFLPCGHDTCRDCYVKLADPSNRLQEGQENGGKTPCPHCRGDIDPKRITDFISFKRVHMPELLTEEEKAQFNIVDDDGSETESEDDSETESEDEVEDDTLGGFIVKDDAEDSETESEAEEADIQDDVDALQRLSGQKSDKSVKKQKKVKKSKKAKGKSKAKATPQLTLAELKKRANSNVKARKKYLRRLREDYKDSAKIRKMMELLENIIETPQELEDETLGKKPAHLAQRGEKILIFSQWTSLLDLCEVEIDRKAWDYRRYDGSMNAKMRADAVDDFKDNKKDVRIMLVSLKAGNAGLNLNVASQVIILDPFWNPYIEEQAIDRAHRIGQERPVKVHRVLVEETVEDRILTLQENKRKLIEQALDEQQASQLSRLGTRELAFLFGITRNITDRVDYQESGH